MNKTRISIDHGYNSFAMAKQKKNTSKNNTTIALNKKALHDFFIEEKHEAGIALQGWEVKSLRAGKCQITDCYVVIKDGEIMMLGAHITPLQTVSTHITPDVQRTRKLLLHRQEIDRLKGLVDRKGYTLVPLKVYWKANRVKVEIGLAKGKHLHDKRASIKERDWKRQKQRILRTNRPLT